MRICNTCNRAIISNIFIIDEEGFCYCNHECRKKGNNEFNFIIKRNNTAQDYEELLSLFMDTYISILGKNKDGDLIISGSAEYLRKAYAKGLLALEIKDEED